MKETYLVTVDRPRTVSITEMKDFLREAEAWRGTFHPEDARNDIKIITIQRQP